MTERGANLLLLRKHFFALLQRPLLIAQVQMMEQPHKQSLHLAKDQSKRKGEDLLPNTSILHRLLSLSHTHSLHLQVCSFTEFMHWEDQNTHILGETGRAKCIWSGQSLSHL